MPTIAVNISYHAYFVCFPTTQEIILTTQESILMMLFA